MENEVFFYNFLKSDENFSAVYILIAQNNQI